MEKLKIALLPILPESSKEDNLNKGMEACRRAKAMGADIALFPEMWSNGYDILRDIYIPKDITALKGSVVPMDSEFVDSFRKLAAELDLEILRKYRESEVHGNAYRRPEKYSLLLSEDIRYPFVRDDRRK